ncbi:hypothetical protein PLICRDRAFT_180605 [Plicaturopsis crispa FD-325 SS-3]|uniref:Uncharacterized protein n=1 Tax=Plicaturopsis crispa FD-325 SS-3 TaxID=944288 RepID=A0A0C9T503_PLICR|nr:hypothetical protein PLICRDRAFT_180605 [Plicaturopsis crispa FD-325 SS-3]
MNPHKAQNPTNATNHSQLAAPSSPEHPTLASFPAQPVDHEEASSQPSGAHRDEDSTNVYDQIMPSQDMIDAASDFDNASQSSSAMMCGLEEGAGADSDAGPTFFSFSEATFPVLHPPEDGPGPFVGPSPLAVDHMSHSPKPTRPLPHCPVLFFSSQPPSTAPFFSGAPPNPPTTRLLNPFPLQHLVIRHRMQPVIYLSPSSHKAPPRLQATLHGR